MSMNYENKMVYTQLGLSKNKSVDVVLITRVFNILCFALLSSLISV